MKQFLVIWFSILFVSIVHSQNVELKHSFRIADNFDALNVQAYNLNGQAKVQELGEYLNLLSSFKSDLSLKNEILQSITLLFQPESITIQSLVNNSIFHSVHDWINDMEKHGIQLIKFQLIEAKLNDSFWTYNYSLSYHRNGKLVSKKVTLFLTMKQISKGFGSAQKNVWQQYISRIIVKD